VDILSKKNAPKKWQKRIFLNYKRVLEKLNLKRKTFLLQNKSEKSENEFPEVSIPNFNGNKDGVELNEDLNITLSSSSDFHSV